MRGSQCSDFRCWGWSMGQQIWAANVKAVRANFLPGLCVQAIALGVVLLYFLVPASRAGFDLVSDFRTEVGMPFAMVSTMIFGGAIPFAVLMALRRVPGGRSGMVKHGLFLVLFWAWKGLEVHIFYHMQAVLFGTESKISTVACKVVMDMFIANPVYFIPVNTLCFMWKDAEFPRCGKFFHHLTARKMLLACASSLVSMWMVWIPCVSLIYSLPESLQLPVQNLILVFWSLLYCTVVQQATSAPAPDNSAEYVGIEAQSSSRAVLNNPSGMAFSGSNTSPAEVAGKSPGEPNGKPNSGEGACAAGDGTSPTEAGGPCAGQEESSSKPAEACVVPISGYAPLAEEKA